MQLVLVCMGTRIYLKELITESLSLWNIEISEQMAKGPVNIYIFGLHFPKLCGTDFYYFFSLGIFSATCHIGN